MNSFIKLLLIFLLFSFQLSAQTVTESKKFIEVTGSAEKSIKPDEIELEVLLTEYSKDGQVVPLSKIEPEFYSILKKNNVDIESLNLNGLETYNWWRWWNSRDKALKSKTLKISLKGNVNLLKLAEDLNRKWVQSINVTDKKNANIQEYRKEVKIEAIKAAKEKASYLLESIGEHLGTVLSVEEIPDENNRWYVNRDPMSNSLLNAGATAAEDVEHVSNIKLRYEIKVRFEIK